MPSSIDGAANGSASASERSSASPATGPSADEADRQPSPSQAQQQQPTSTVSQSDGPAPDSQAQDSQHSLDYQALYDQIKHMPCHVEHLSRMWEERDEKLRTKPHLIDRELERIYAAQTLEEVHMAMEEAGRALQQLGVFSHVDLLANEEPQDQEDACTVLLELKEKNWYKAHAATYFQGGENTVELGFGLHSARGNAEHVTLTAEYGTQLSNLFSFNYEQPRPYGWPITAEAHLAQQVRNRIKTSSFSEKLRGITLGIRSMDGQHSLQYELGWRSLIVDVINTGASRAVAAQAGDFLKAAARYTWMYDQRDSPVTPSRGWALRTTSEVAGLGPDQGLRFVKQQVDAQLLLPITRSIILNLSASTGVLLPWGGQQPLSRPTCIADRFFLGGPSSLRGFKYQGVGPTDERRQRYARIQAGTSSSAGAGSAAGQEAGATGPESTGSRRDALGGDLYTSLLAEVTFPLPHKLLKSLNLQGHVFVNGGNCDLLSGTGQSLSDRAKQWAASWRWSAGAGVLLPTWFGRFEANYVHVISAQEYDRVKRGVQLGFASSIFH